MSDFQQNLFSNQINNPQQMQMNNPQFQMNSPFQTLEMLKRISQNQNMPNLNNQQFFPMEQKQNPNPNINSNNSNPIGLNQIFNINPNKDNHNPSNQNISKNNNFVNSNINPNSNNINNININPQYMSNESQLNQINKNINANKNKLTTKPENINQNSMNENLLNSNNNFINNNNLNNNIQEPSSNSQTKEKLDKSEKTPESKKTKLENKFSFLYRIDQNNSHQAQKQILAKEKYESQVKKIAEFDTIEDFWGIFQHLRKPDSCRPGIEYFMFKEPVKPLWEDENNKNGGRFSLKLKRGYTTIIWEEMIFTLIGGILPKEIKDEINGIVVTSKKEFNTLQIWFRNYDDKIKDDIEECLRDLLVIPKEVKLESKKFNVNMNINNSNNNNNNSNNNKKEYGNYNNNNINNNNNKNNNNKSGGYRDKGYYNNNNNNNNNNYYGEGRRNYNKDNKKGKYQSYKNNKK